MEPPIAEEGDEAEDGEREVDEPLVAAAVPLAVSVSEWRPMGRSSESRSVPLFGCGVIASESQIKL